MSIRSEGLYFFPLYSQAECQHTKAQSFIKKIYGGTFKSMLVQFIQEDSLSEEAIKDLRSILDEKTKKIVLLAVRI